MKLRKSREHRRGRIEIINMIDVMFFLLAAFMLATLNMQHIDGLSITLPKGQATAVSETKPLMLTVTADSNLLLDQVPVTLDSLVTALKPLVRGPDQKLIIAADNKTPQGTVVQAMLRARGAGIQHFMFAVQHE